MVIMYGYNHNCKCNVESINIPDNIKKTIRKWGAVRKCMPERRKARK